MQFTPCVATLRISSHCGTSSKVPSIIHSLRLLKVSRYWTVSLKNPLVCLQRTQVSYLGASSLAKLNYKVTSRRAALVPFSLSDGTKVRPGDWVCVPMEAMMRDPELYPNPDSFNAFRFVDPKRLKNAQQVQPEGESKFTDPSYKWGMWGNFRTAW